MYEQFGARVEGDSVTFSLFIPDNTRDSTQYRGIRDPRIAHLHVLGSFQATRGGPAWDLTSAEELQRTDHASGHVYELRLAGLPDGWYTYKYLVTFDNGLQRWITDPCAKYIVGASENGGFVVGGRPLRVEPLAKPRKIGDEVIYQLLMTDFTAGYRRGRAPADAVRDRLDYLVDLGVTAVQFLPWMAWPDRMRGRWGYDGNHLFAAEDDLIEDLREPLDRLSRLGDLVTACHERGLGVYLDSVLNQIQVGDSSGFGFAYHWLYLDPDDSPYTGNFEGHLFPTDLDYASGCTRQFVADSCLYWLTRYRLDGIRFDYSLGYHRPGDFTVGLGRLVGDLRKKLSEAGHSAVTMIIEHMSEPRYDAIDVANRVGADSAWFDPLFWELRNAVRDSKPYPDLLRALGTARDFAPTSAPTVYSANHDHSNLFATVGGRDRWWAVMPALIAVYTVSGAVQLHNAQEFGQVVDIPEQDTGRVVPRPLRWELADDEIGSQVLDLHRRLAALRVAHPVLRGRGFHPRPDDHPVGRLGPDGYGVDTDRGLAVYRRSAPRPDVPGTENHAVVALNFSDAERTVTLDLPATGQWNDALGGPSVAASRPRATITVPPHWGRVYLLSSPLTPVI